MNREKFSDLVAQLEWLRRYHRESRALLEEYAKLPNAEPSVVAKGRRRVERAAAKIDAIEAKLVGDERET